MCEAARGGGGNFRRRGNQRIEPCYTIFELALQHPWTMMIIMGRMGVMFSGCQLGINGQLCPRFRPLLKKYLAHFGGLDFGASSSNDERIVKRKLNGESRIDGLIV